MIFLSPVQLVGDPVRGRCGTASVVTQFSMLLLGCHYSDSPFCSNVDVFNIIKKASLLSAHFLSGNNVDGSDALMFPCFDINLYFLILMFINGYSVHIVNNLLLVGIRSSWVRAGLQNIGWYKSLWDFHKMLPAIISINIFFLP